MRAIVEGKMTAVQWLERSPGQDKKMLTSKTSKREFDAPVTEAE
jgi:hypothetical protein